MTADLAALLATLKPGLTMAPLDSGDNAGGDT